MNGEQRLGKKTFWLFVLSNSTACFIFLLTTVVSVVLRGFVGDNFIDILNYLTIASIFLFALSFLSDISISWLTYINYTFTMDQDSFKVKHGIFSKEETAIPYRQVQSVDLRQDLMGQLLGYSRIVVLTAGHDEKDEQGEAEAIFPVLDSNLAKNLQAELLKRSETERVTMQK